MTEGLKRIYGEGHLHFISSSCYQRRPYMDADRRDLCLHIMEEARQRFHFVVVGYVVKSCYEFRTGRNAVDGRPPTVDKRNPTPPPPPA